MLPLLRGKTLARMFRASDDAEDTAIEWYGLSHDQLFQYAPGPVFIAFDDGTLVGLNSDAAKCSVILWIVKDGLGTLEKESGSGPEAFAHRFFSATSDWRGTQIDRVEVYREAPRNARFTDLQRESALILYLENGESLAFVHGLHDDSDDFAVITPAEIQEEFKAGWECVGYW